MRLRFAHRMRIYEASIRYNLIQNGQRIALSSPDLIAEYMANAFDTHPTQESFWVVMLNRKNRPIGRIMVTLGTLGSTLVHPREVMRPAIIASASAIVVVHNHPSGDPSPSAADIRVTRQLREASKMIEIDLLDHVIIGTKEDDPTGLGYYSFRTAGFL